MRIINERSADIARSIDKSVINELPLTKYEGNIKIIQNQDELGTAITNILNEDILGFDIETKPTFKKGLSHNPSIMQIAGKNSVYLFYLKNFECYNLIGKILSNANIVKTGVAIHEDIKKLQELIDFEPAGFVELSDITKGIGIINTGLRSLAAIFLNVRISKTVQISNWDRQPLSNAQVHYAATDAWVSREIYVSLKNREIV